MPNKDNVMLCYNQEEIAFGCEMIVYNIKQF